MKHILIADAGSTKIEWALISENGSSRHIGVKEIIYKKIKETSDS